jgi:hypothetical protein
VPLLRLKKLEYNFECKIERKFIEIMKFINDVKKLIEIYDEVSKLYKYGGFINDYKTTNISFVKNELLIFEINYDSIIDLLYINDKNSKFKIFEMDNFYNAYKNAIIELYDITDKITENIYKNIKESVDVMCLNNIKGYIIKKKDDFIIIETYNFIKSSTDYYVSKSSNKLTIEKFIIYLKNCDDELNTYLENKMPELYLG